jgi:hypothetical protein
VITKGEDNGYEWKEPQPAAGDLLQIAKLLVATKGDHAREPRKMLTTIIYRQLRLGRG